MQGGILGFLTAGSLLLIAGCAQLTEVAERYKEEQVDESLNLDQPVAKLSVEEIAEEFEANSIMAENKYMNQPVELTGYIGMIDDSLFDEENVSITITGGEYSLSSVSCLKPRSAPEVRELRRGMRVAVRGVVTSEEMGVELSRCKFRLSSQNRWIGGSQPSVKQRSQVPARTNIESESWEASKNNHQERSDSSNQATKIPQGKARFYSSTTKETKDIGVELTTRKNRNNHTVLDAQWEDGLTSSYVFWKSGVVEILSKDGEGKIDNTPGTWVQRDGNTVITSKKGSITTFPGIVPVANGSRTSFVPKEESKANQSIAWDDREIDEEVLSSLCEGGIMGNTFNGRGSGFMMYTMRARMMNGNLSTADYNQMREWFSDNCPDGW